MSLPSSTLKRVHLPALPTPSVCHQTRHASLLRRPQRPYTFTQLVVLSDGSTYTQRTTSPLPVYRSTKDTKNHALWQPSSSVLRNMESDQAGRLRAFRKKFGRGWDLDAREEKEGEAVEASGKEEEEGRGTMGQEREEEDSLMDLISGFAEGQGKGTSKK